MVTGLGVNAFAHVTADRTGITLNEFDHRADDLRHAAEMRVIRRRLYGVGLVAFVLAALFGSFGVLARATDPASFAPLGAGILAGNGRKPIVQTSEVSLDLTAFGGLAARDAYLGRVDDVVVGDDGWAYIADSDKGFQMIDPATGFITTPIPRPALNDAAAFGITPPNTAEEAIQTPHFLAYAGDDKVLISGANRLLLFDRSDNTVVSVAGTGLLESFGDNGPAIDAGIDPQGIVFTRDGTAYVVDGAANKVRKIAYDGTISTFAGSNPGDETFPVDPLPLPGEPGYLGDGGLAINAQLNGPSGLALSRDELTLYVADTNNRRIRAIDLTTGAIATLAGTGEEWALGDLGAANVAAIGLPRDLAIDPVDGSLFFSDIYNRLVRRIDLASGVITTFIYDPQNCAGCAPAELAQDQAPTPFGLSFASLGQVLIVTDSVINRATSFVIHLPEELPTTTLPTTTTTTLPTSSTVPDSSTTTTTLPGTPTTTLPDSSTTVPSSTTIPEPTTTIPSSSTTTTTTTLPSGSTTTTVPTSSTTIPAAAVTTTTTP